MAHTHGLRKFLESLFSEDTGPSWFRILGTPAVIAAMFGFVWSILNKYDTGVMYSSVIISGIFGFKSLQKGFEAKGAPPPTDDGNTYFQQPGAMNRPMGQQSYGQPSSGYVQPGAYVQPAVVQPAVVTTNPEQAGARVREDQ